MLAAPQHPAGVWPHSHPKNLIKAREPWPRHTAGGLWANSIFLFPGCVGREADGVGEGGQGQSEAVQLEKESNSPPPEPEQRPWGHGGVRGIQMSDKKRSLLCNLL